ncbi:RnfH family protein [Polaromonas sp.]|uniref:RnfH family protein n=1 Tax=Polaromonas sp. TaxID=1869339 RepID=UPI002869F851|nr:RnfH family protein [Polaromonas sp.]
MDGKRLNIVLVYSPAPRQVREWRLTLAAGATVTEALARCGIFEEFPDLPGTGLTLGIWGKKTSLNHQLRDQDRLEIYRGLRVDPKVARRERFNRQGAKSAGLFAKTRVGAKAGY